MEPSGVAVTRPIGRVAQPKRMTGPVATLRSRAIRRNRRIIAHEHRLGERVVPLVGQGQEHPLATAGAADLPRAAGEHEDRRLAPLAPDLELAPAHAEPEPRAERLQPGLLPREARPAGRDRIAARA